MIKLGIGCDHAAYQEKELLMEYLIDLGYEVLDFGCYSKESVDYPEFGHRVGNAVNNGEIDRGVVICGSGIGISIAANKIKGVRAALCTSDFHAEMSRKHNDSNIIAFGARFSNIDDIKRMTKIWIETSFEGGRHLDRIRMIEL